MARPQGLCFWPWTNLKLAVGWSRRQLIKPSYNCLNMRTSISDDSPFLHLLFLDKFLLLNGQKLRCTSVSLPSLSPSFAWNWYPQDGRHSRFRHVYTFWVCYVVWRSRYSPEALRPLNACQGIFSTSTISFLMVWCHFSVLVMRKMHHIWGVKVAVPC